MSSVSHRVSRLPDTGTETSGEDASLGEIQLPRDLDYLSVRGLRRESALKLADLRPTTLGQAAESWVNPAVLAFSWFWWIQTIAQNPLKRPCPFFP